MHNIPEEAQTVAMRRNLRLYPWYTATFNGLAWLPIFFLYFSAHLSPEAVLRLEALYFSAMVLLEVPSGYFSDVVGRRLTLLLSALAMVAAYTLFLVGSGFWIFALAQVLLAAGFAFNSGTDTALLYDSLAALKQTAQYGQREAIAVRNAHATTSLAVLLGGLAGMVSLHLAYAVSLLSALATLMIVSGFRDPDPGRSFDTPRLSFKRQLTVCLGRLRAPVLAWLFGFYVLMTILNHIPYIFYQPYLALLGAALSFSPNRTPLASGLALAGGMAIAAWAASHSIGIRDRLGTGCALLLTTLLQTLLITAMAWFLHPVVAVLLVLRSAPHALMRAPLNAAIAPHVAQQQRATYLSIQSLAGRLAFSGVLMLLSYQLTPGMAMDWAALSHLSTMSVWLGIAGLLILSSTMWVLPQRRRRQR